MSQEHHKVIIAGSGCAGHTAAIYAGRAGLHPVVFEGNEPGGQLSLTSDVENFPGFPEGIGGFAMIEGMKKQAERFGAKYEWGAITKLEGREPPYTLTVDGSRQLSCDTFIIATGAACGEGSSWRRGCEREFACLLSSR